MLKKGDTINVWLEDRKVIEVTPYTGLYKGWFTHTVKFTTDTPRGWGKIAINMDDYKG